MGESTKLLHPGQVPVLTIDQSLFVIVKKIQWTWPETYEKDKFAVMIEGMHIGMALLKFLGDGRV